MDKPLLLVGYKGMLGTELMRILTESGTWTVPVDVDEMDVTSSEAVIETFANHRPSIVINASAFTDVDGCESKADAAHRVNALGPENLARAAADNGSVLVHVSTDYVFDGTKGIPYKEDDSMNPLGVYGQSKADGEKRVREIIPENHCIVRTQWLYGLHGKNFVDTIMRLAQSNDVLRIVNDQYGSPTYAPDLADALVKLVGMRGRGTFHVTNSGLTTWCDFARRIVERSSRRKVVVESMSTEELQRPAPRPLYGSIKVAKPSLKPFPA
ncbi:MAG: dTDP-4-dehydrorhamnose reductase [Desulfomonile tiedjei]|uniref:dTDP-4-dehydrorhamnose reductase n=1 Tax=Desulfomonile tiedjei TaxID=2358 RepID=A0A9D6Z304_9BACT|nr:dTDP-4-dehydrorhamnose reductase [Desulfomonile tiedjei]